MEVRGAPQLLLLLLVHRGGGAGEGGGEGVPRPQVCGDCLILGRHLGHRALAAATGPCTPTVVHPTLENNFPCVSVCVTFLLSVCPFVTFSTLAKKKHA